MNTANDIAVHLENLGKHYGSVHALQGISLSVRRGSFYGLLGPNGAGKTTLIGILGGLVSPTAGRGSVLGKDIVHDALAVRRLVGIVPQELVYDPFFRVREALVFQSKYYGITNNSRWIDTLIEKLHLTDKVNTNTRALSGGMKRRLMIAQALVHKPPLLVLDEPTAGVDINLRLSLWEFVRELNQSGHTIILTTHYLEEAEALCDYVALINRGKIAAEGSTRELLLSAPHAVRVRIRAHNMPPQTSALPPATSTEPDGTRSYDIASTDGIEPLLAAYRAAGATLDEISVSPPKLEEVFVQLIAQSNHH